MVSVRKAWIAALGLALAACAEVGPDYRVPPAALANAPAASGAFVAGATAASNAPLPARWWRLYDDPALDALIERALASNVDLRAAQAKPRAQQRAARGGAHGARAERGLRRVDELHAAIRRSGAVAR